MLPKGESLEIVGRNADSSWWQVFTPYGRAWIAAFVVEASRVDDSIPVVKIPALGGSTSERTSIADTDNLGTAPTRVVAAKANCPDAGVQITSPTQNSQFTSTWVLIKGTASIPNFDYYKIEYSTDPNSATWHYLLQRDAPVENDTLLELNTSTVPKGPYGVRLTVVDRSGNYPEPCIVWYRNGSGFVSQPPIPPSGWGCRCDRDRYNCSDFDEYDQAQACFNFCISEGRGEIHELDREDDGLACEWLP